MRVLLTNLLGNAWKFTSHRPHVTIEFGQLPSPTGQNDPTFFVCDNGAGFDMAYVGKLFAPFQRLHGAEEFSGSGIGLATAQRIVLRHGGRIWAQGTPDKGAILYFTLAPRRNPGIVPTHQSDGSDRADFASGGKLGTVLRDFAH